MENVSLNRRQHLPAKIKQVWLWRCLLGIVSGIVVPALVYFACQWSNFFNPWLNYLAFGCGVIAALWVAVSVIDLVLIPYHYQFWTFQLSENFIEITKGYIFRKQTTIPLARLQTVTLEDGVLLRAAGLWEVNLHTAADEFELAALSESQAKALRTQLVAMIKREGDENE